MSCQKVREGLVSYLAGECSLREQQFISRHLAECARCSSEKAALEFLDDMLDTWSAKKSPPGITGNIMCEIQKEHAVITRNKPVSGLRSKPSSFPGLLRDLVAAAVVTLAVFGVGGSWLNPGSFDSLGKNVNGVARSYTHITTNAVEQVVSTANTYTGKINVKEWNIDEVYKSR